MMMAIMLVPFARPTARRNPDRQAFAPSRNKNAFRQREWSAGFPRHGVEIPNQPAPERRHQIRDFAGDIIFELVSGCGEMRDVLLARQLFFKRCRRVGSSFSQRPAIAEFEQT
jgi:hypothetical protein